MSKTIQFTDTSTNANTYFWDFGDGNTSTERNPIHTYQDDGEYVVTHTVTNDFGEASIEQTVSLGDTQVDEETQIDDTEPNPINPPFGYLPPDVLLTGTLSPEGQWYWDGYTWNTLEPQPSFPPAGYNPAYGDFMTGALSSNGQWIWDGQNGTWNLNVGVDEQEPIEETIDEEPSYQLTLNEESEGDNDLINFGLNGIYESFNEGDVIELIVTYVAGYDDVQLRPFITTPTNLQIQLIQQNNDNARYQFTMPAQDVEITAIGYQFSFEVKLTGTVPLGNTQAFANGSQINGNNPTIPYEVLSDDNVQIVLNATEIDGVFNDWEIISGDNFQGNTIQLSEELSPQTVLTIGNEADSNNFGTIQIRANFVEDDDDNGNGGNGGNGGNSGSGRNKRTGGGGRDADTGGRGGSGGGDTGDY